MEHLTGFEAWLISEKNVAINTLNSYLRDIRQFLTFLVSINVAPEKANQQVFHQYTKHLSAQGKSVATITRSVASIKSFYTYLQQLHLDNNNLSGSLHAIGIENMSTYFLATVGLKSKLLEREQSR